jgi:hypothetical protein
MEVRLGHDFREVRVYPRTDLADLTGRPGIAALTVGNEVFFAPERYQPNTRRGRWLIAHELAHVREHDIHPGGRQEHAYEGWEHQYFGDKGLEDLLAFLNTPEGVQWAKAIGRDPVQLIAEIKADPQFQGAKIQIRPGKELTPGQIISLMGDFTASPHGINPYAPGARSARPSANLGDLTNAQIDAILDTMAKEEEGTISGTDATVIYQEIDKEYLGRARFNASHFASLNREYWRRLHRAAIARALEAMARASPQLLQEALALDAAGGHYLTDAFAAGHMFDEPTLVVEIQKQLQVRPFRGLTPQGTGLITALDLIGLAPIADLVRKNVHDHFNATGVTVKNAKGMTWQGFGDVHLKSSPETMRIGALAVFLSRSQVYRAFRGETPDEAEVLDLMPTDDTITRVTNEAIQYVPTAMSEVQYLASAKSPLLKTKVGSTLNQFFVGPTARALLDPSLGGEIERWQQQRDPLAPYPGPVNIRAGREGWSFMLTLGRVEF